MLRARKPDIQYPTPAAPRRATAWREEARWPLHLRFLFMIGAALACWAMVLAVGYWLIG